MTDSVKEAFLMEKEYQEKARLESKDEIDGYEDFIFVNRFGHVQHQGTLNKALRRIIRDYNVVAAAKAERIPTICFRTFPAMYCAILMRQEQ